MFAVQNVPRQKFEIPGLTATRLEIDSITAKFDLFAAFVEGDGQLILRMEYNADLFKAEISIERMVANFRTLYKGSLPSGARIWTCRYLAKPEKTSSFDGVEQEDQERLPEG